MAPRRGTPSTILVRWPSANQQSAMSILARKLSGVNTGRRSIQIRTFRSEGKGLYVVRTLSNTENMVVLVEDPKALTRRAVDERERTTTAMTAGTQAYGGENREEKVFVRPEHTRWTCCTMAAALQTSYLATPFDSFLHRVLIGGSTPAQTASGGWQPRSVGVGIEGFGLCAAGPGGVLGDWEFRVGQIVVKGGASGATAKGLLIEATYLPVPYLPYGSTYVRDFVTSIFPSQAVSSGEIEFVDIPEEEFYDAGLIERPDESKGEGEGEWEWTEAHSAFAYVRAFKIEGLL